MRRASSIVGPFLAIRSRTALDLVDGAGETGLDLLCRHLWARSLAEGRIRLVLNSRDDAAKDDVAIQEYWVVPSRHSPEILIPADSKKLTSRALLSYRKLRTPRGRLARGALGTAARVGIRPSFDRLRVERATTTTVDGAVDPIGQIGEQLGLPDIRAAIGIRRGANAKASLHLFRTDGAPAGLAKVSWNALTRGFVATESQVLKELDGQSGQLRTPLLLASGSLGPERFLVAEPLPARVRQSGGPNGLSLLELTGLFPIIRSDRVTRSAQLLTAARRIRELPPNLGTPSMSQAFESLWATLLDSPTRVGITERWHGDLVPWNVGRDADGEAWLWDWESSEVDAVAGLDVVHWTIHSQPDWERHSIASNLRRARPGAELALRALGQGTRQQLVVHAAYAVTIAARATDLATAHGSWDRVRLGQDEITHLLEECYRMIVEV